MVQLKACRSRVINVEKWATHRIRKRDGFLHEINYLKSRKVLWQKDKGLGPSMFEPTPVTRYLVGVQMQRP